MPDLIDELTADHVNAEPRVNEESVAALSAKLAGDDDQANNAPQREPVTSAGGGTTIVPPPPPAHVKTDVFDPRIHKTDRRGRPIRRKDGKGFAKKPGPKPPLSDGEHAPAATVGAAAADSPPAAPPNYAKLGEFAAGAFFGATQTILGPAWAPNPDEKTRIEQATTDYCASQGFSDIPPGVALIIALGMYAAPRFADPETRGRIRKFAESLGLVRPAPAPRDQAPPAVRYVPAPPPPPPAGIPAPIDAPMPLV